MIKATFVRRDDTRYLLMTVKGHAGMDDKGHDLVCASASILAYTVAQIVKTMEHHGDLVGEPIINMNPGDTEICCQCKNDDIFAECAHAFFVAKTGYSLLVHNFPQYVELETVGEA